jgi:hypothetical protein
MMAGLCLIASAQASAQSLTTSQQTAVSNLQGTSLTIKSQVSLGLGISAGLATSANTGTIVDPTAYQAGQITEQQRLDYNASLSTFRTTDFYNAQQFFRDQAANSIVQMQQAITALSNSAVELQKAATVNQMVSGITDAAQAKQVQGVVNNSPTLSSEIGAATVGNYNSSLAQVNSYATQAASFFQAANNTQLTNTVDLTKTNYGKDLAYAGAYFAYGESRMLLGWADGFNFSVSPVLDEYKQSSADFYQANNLMLGAPQ